MGQVIFFALVGLGKGSYLWVWKISIFFSKGQKNLIRLGRVKKYPDQRRIGFLFTASQKYPWLGSGLISTCLCTQPANDMLSFNTIRCKEVFFKDGRMLMTRLPCPLELHMKTTRQLANHMLSAQVSMTHCSQWLREGHIYRI